jgi:hypothetical protein
MSIIAIVERDETDLLHHFADLRRKFGNDLGVIVAGLHSEIEERLDAIDAHIAELEARLAKLESVKRR